MTKATNGNKPYLDIKFMKKLGMKPNVKDKKNITIYSWLKYNKTIPLKILLKILELSNKNLAKIEPKINSIKINYAGAEISPKFPIKINKKLGSVVGHILGDGSIDSKHTQVSFSNSNKELLKEFERNMLEVFGVKPRIWMQKTATFEGKTRWEKRLNIIDELKENRSCSLFYPKICGLILNSIFDNFAIGKNKTITKKIITLNKDFKAGLIRAFYDDEGSISKGGKNIRLFQDKKDILESFRSLLKEFKIKPNDIKTYFKRNKERYYFDIYRKSNFIKFQKEIGFTNPKKKERLKQLTIIKNFKNSK